MSPTTWVECELSTSGALTLMGLSVWPVTASQWVDVTGQATAYTECSIANPSYTKKTSTNPSWVEDTA